MSTVSASTGKPANLRVKTFKSAAQFKANRMQELERLSTFDIWPESNTSSPLSLARSGFAYSGEGNKVFCPHCQIKLDNLTRDDNPAEEHRRRSPECPFANQIATLDSSSEPIAPSSIEASSGTNSALWDLYNSASRRFHSQNRQEDPVPNARSPNARPLSPTVRVDRTNPDYELLRRERIRLDTFYDWPLSAHAVPEALARDGFFYTGSTDRVRCAFCHNTLHTWAPGDIPSEEHRKHFPRCPFVLGLNIGNVGIENDNLREETSGQNLLSLTGGVMTGASAGQRSVELPSVGASMSTPAVRAALEMGFSEENVKQVVQQCITETGQLFPSAELLVEQLLSLGISQSYRVTSGAQNTNTASTSKATSASSAATSSSANLAFPPPCAASSSAKLSFPTFTSSHDAHLSSATVASPACLGATSSLPAAATSAAAASSSSIAAAQTAASASLGGETEQRAGEEERSEETSFPHNEGAKKGNGSTMKRKRGPRKAKTGASLAGSSGSQIGSSEAQAAVGGETSSGSVAAAAGNSSAEENAAGLVVDPEEQQLLDENSRLKEARTCKVCMDKEVNTVFLPCGHLICCDICSPKIRNCPLCRTFIRGTVKTYLS